jgi:hypothetical protein
MTSLLIAHPDTPFVAPYIYPSAAANAYKREYNLIAGDRATMFELAAAGTSFSLTFGLGSTTRAADHLILARADILQTIGVTTVTLAYSSDDSSYSTAYTNASFASATAAVDVQLNGGGNGKSKGGGGRQHPVSPWGQLSKGFKTRKKHKPSDRFIVERRKSKKKN